MNKNVKVSHENAEIIKAKIDNMDLFTFIKPLYADTWEENYINDICGNVGADYFICHPKNKRAVLHWLNGGTIQQLNCVEEWEDKPNFNFNKDKDSWHYFLRELRIRIKSKKEPRWIGIDVNQNITTEPFRTEEELDKYANEHIRVYDFQPIMIFVDVAIT
ncbi:MAG: hypothetical protein HRS57_02150 [Mycoplasmataceae bacterium]|nr:hypothetical protein [Mycoplasmataceae bacterium]